MSYISQMDVNTYFQWSFIKTYKDENKKYGKKM